MQEEIYEDESITCNCGLKIYDIDFVDYRCILCFEDEYECKCLNCGYIDNHEFYTNYLCMYCFFGCEI